MSGPRGLGRIDFFLRRASGLVLIAFFGAYLLLLAREGRGIWLGDVGRLGGPGARALEIVLIGLLSYHAASALGQWVLERLSPARHHTLVFVASVLLAVAFALVHVPVLGGSTP
jgi:succinate dehydrogenase hydrophobic anchor subunit